MSDQLKALCKSKILGVLCVLGVVAGLTFPAWAAKTDPVAAVVNGAEIRLSDVRAAQDLLPPQMQGVPFDKVYGMLLDSLINSRLAATQAKKLGLGETQEYKDRMARIGNQVLERMALSRYIASRLSEDMLKKRYEVLVKKTRGKYEIHARHILVRDEKEAQKIIAELNKGGDFATLARDRSIGPNARDGGDLGWFGPGSMLPSLEKIAMSLSVGEVSRPPVKTQFGWNIIKVVERRAQKIPPFATMRSKIAAVLSAELGQAYMVGLRRKATIVKNPLKTQ